jgi:hypothetical protein
MASTHIPRKPLAVIENDEDELTVEGSTPPETIQCYTFEPLLRHIVYIHYGMQVHPTEPMRYSTSDKALKQEGEDAGYEIPITHYAFRRGTGNEANRKAPKKEVSGRPIQRI